MMCPPCRFAYDPNASLPGPDSVPGAGNNAWVCVDCGAVYSEPDGYGGTKTCGKCGFAILETVSYSQHLHDRCVPDEQWEWVFSGRKR